MPFFSFLLTARASTKQVELDSALLICTLSPQRQCFITVASCKLDLCHVVANADFATVVVVAEDVDATNTLVAEDVVATNTLIAEDVVATEVVAEYDVATKVVAYLFVVFADFCCHFCSRCY